MAYKGAGIYGLYNVMENKIYIGASISINGRFKTHISNFSAKSKSSMMYSEPIENFVFLVLQKMTDEEFEKYGALLEHLFIIKAQERHIGVYNRNKLWKDATADVLGTLKIDEKLIESIKEKCGRSPTIIGMMSYESRKEVLDNIPT